MSGAFLILLSTWNVIFMYEAGMVEAQNQCNVNADCSNTNMVCCEGYFHNRSKSCQFFSCFGRHCLTDGDCGGKGECCKSHQCVTLGCPECQLHSNCATSEYCCKHRYNNDHNVCRRSCVRETCHSSNDCAVGECCLFNKCVKNGCSDLSAECSSNFDCSASEYCCKRGLLKNVCRRSCVGETCHSSNDCAVGECCLFNKCVKNGCSDLSAECSSNFDCSASEYCCKRGLLKNVCSRSCVGETCFSNSGCGAPGEHCDSNFKCSKSETNSTTLAGWVIGIVAGNYYIIQYNAIQFSILQYNKIQRSKITARTNTMSLLASYVY